MRRIDGVVDEVDHFAVLRTLAFEQGARADLLHGATRAQVVLAHMEPDAIGPARRVLQHQLLHLAIDLSAPAVAGDEGIADGQLALVRIPVVIAGGADDAARALVDHHQRAAGIQRALEQPAETFGIGTRLVRVLLPQQRIACHLPQRVAVFGSQRPEQQRRTTQDRLRIELRRADWKRRPASRP